MKRNTRFISDNRTRNKDIIEIWGASVEDSVDSGENRDIPLLKDNCQTGYRMKWPE